jgi:porphobilinogen synthase
MEQKPATLDLPPLGIHRKLAAEPADGSSPLRGRSAVRRMLHRQRISAADLCMPLLIVDDNAPPSPVPTVTLEHVGREVTELATLGVGAVKIFAGTARRDMFGSDATNLGNVMNAAIDIAKTACPDMAVLTENCLCSYTEDRVCYVPQRTGHVDYTATLTALTEQARQQAASGADVIGPAGMIDGSVAAVRDELDRLGFRNVAIMPHLIFTSQLYAGYRQAMNATPRSGNRAAFQLHPTQADQAIELGLRWLAEGADMLLLEPAMHTLDVLVRLRLETTAPLVPFSVSGEHMQLTRDGRLAVSEYGNVLTEQLNVFKRSGAAMIVTYAAKEAARLLNGELGRQTIPAQRPASAETP